MSIGQARYDIESAGDYFDGKRRRYSRALLNCDLEGSMEVVDELITTRQNLGEIYLKVITPALEGVGESWCRGDIGVGEQKLATELVIGQIDRLRAHFAPPVSKSLYRVMIACIEGEQHFIGARMAADLCGAYGWNVDFLGADVANEALIAMVHRRKPQVLGLSVTMIQGLEHVRWVVNELEQSAPEVRVIIGGQALADNGGVKNISPRCEIVRDIMLGVTSIGRLLRAGRPKSALKEYQLVLARRVRELRTKRGWTQEHLAEVTHVARACIIAVEGGKQNVSMDILVRMANALEVPAETLLSAEGGFSDRGVTG